MTVIQTVKTAVSLDRALFERAEALADILQLTRSRIVALALEEFLRRHESRSMLDQLNSVYGEPEQEAERASREGMKDLQRALVDGEWRSFRETYFGLISDGRAGPGPDTAIRTW